MTDTSRLGTCKTVREILDCSDSTLRRYRKDENLNFPKPVLQFGRPRFRLADIETWIEEQARGTGTKEEAQ